MSELDRLREYVRRLETVIGIDSSDIAPLRRAFPKMEPDVARILAMILKRDFVTRDGLYSVMYTARPECDWPSENVLDVQVHRLRGHLETCGAVVNTTRTEGWFMSKADKNKVRAALEQAPLLDLEAVALATDQRNKRQAMLCGAQ